MGRRHAVVRYGRASLTGAKAGHRRIQAADGAAQIRMGRALHTVARCRDGAGCRIKRRSAAQIGRHAGTQGAQARRCGSGNTSQLPNVDRIGGGAAGSKIRDLAFGAR
ncbi:hypothetical protein D3C78_1601110 [compost metagenome]